MSRSNLSVTTALYVGEKSRPGRPPQRRHADGLFLGENPEAPLYLDNIRLERNTETAKALFDGLWAFDLGSISSPIMEGLTALDVGNRFRN